MNLTHSIRAKFQLGFSVFALMPFVAHAQFFNDPGSSGAPITNFTTGGISTTVVTGASPVAIKAMSYMAASYTPAGSPYLPNFKLSFFIYDNGPDNGNYLNSGDWSGRQMVWVSPQESFTSSSNADFAWRRSSDFMPITLLPNRKYLIGAFTEDTPRMVNFRMYTGNFSAGGYTSRPPVRFLDSSHQLLGALPAGRLQLQLFQASTDLAITKSRSTPTVATGGNVTYTITASNAGPDAANATVADAMPASLSGVTWTCVGAGGAACSASGSGNINDAVALPVGSSVTYTVSGTLASSASGTLSNTATVTAQDGLLETNLANNTATDTATISQVSDLAVTLTGTAGPVLPGANVAYTLTATNAGPTPATAASLTSTLAAQLQDLQWTCTATGGATCAPSGSGAVSDSVNLPAGGSVVYSINGKVMAGTVASTLSNTANIAPPSGYSDTNAANNQATFNTVVAAVAPPSEPAAVPTLREWALLLLSAMVAGLAVLGLRLRRAA
ncbi:DUF11 domain-containing protein [Diaphorobacter sp. HDW4B]|uniref:DUF11 domain-containing protein n=1 Tax=Diaphorobacter sp. HDW4B TaxID=2714925 RepID=UPI00140CC1C3|nr:DUF11 domain-containing protein [Diaphorobacter sp. HDW4B]QIL73066.1 DUF11 domain-containing protein [Diaphorobacter sp. HDW4B]